MGGSELKIILFKSKKMYAFPLQGIEDQERFEDSSFFDIKCQPAWHGLPMTDLPHQQSFSCDDDFMDNSFEQLSNQHPQAIENAFVEYKKANLVERENENFGMHELHLRNITENFVFEQKLIKEMINSNKLLTQKQKKLFLEDLRKDTIFSQTVKGLACIFDEQALEEAIFLIQRSWEKYLNFQKNFVIKKPIIPMFKRIYDFDTFDGLQQEVAKFNISEKKLQKESKRVAELFRREYFNDSRIKILNLKSASGKISNEKQLKEGFAKLLKVLCKAVFLSAEGEFRHPEERNVAEENRRSHTSMFVESFSQGQKESEFEDSSIRCQPCKKRKLQ